MIPHDYFNDNVNLAQYSADLLDRQEVTVDWYLDNMIDECVFRWMGDEDDDMDLDPWRYYADLPIDAEDAKARGWRLFVQRKDMPEEFRDLGNNFYFISTDTGHIRTDDARLTELNITIDQLIANPSVLDLSGDAVKPVIYFVTKNGKDYWQAGAYV